MQTQTQKTKGDNMSIDTTFEIVEMSPSEMASLKHERVSNAKSYEIAKAIMSSKMSSGAVSVNLANESKGRSLSGTVNSVLKRFESTIRTIYRVDEKTHKQYLIFHTVESTTEPANAEPEPEPAIADNTGKKSLKK